MAKVHYVREGDDPTSGEPLEVALSVCVDLLGLSKGNPFSSDRRRLPGTRMAAFTGPRSVVVEVDEDEGRPGRWKPGFYIAPISVSEARRALAAVQV